MNIRPRGRIQSVVVSVDGQAGLFEREATLATAVAVIDRARAGGGGSAFILGEAGIGKTAVLEEIGRRVEGQLAIGLARGEQMGRNMPFGFATQALASLGAPDLIDVTDEHPREPSAAYFRVLKWLDRPAREPVLLLLDDLQWADADSLALFAFLARRLRSLRVAFVATVRPWPREAAIAAHALHDAGQGELIQLAALGE